MAVQVGVSKPENPVVAAWQGGSRLGASPQYAQQAMTKAVYEERGLR